MKTRTVATDRFSRGDEEYSRSPGALAASIVFATLFSGAIFFGLSQAQRTAEAGEPPVVEDLRAVVVLAPPPPPISQTATATTENLPPSIDFAMGAVETAQPDAVLVAAAPLAEIAEPNVTLKADLLPGAFRPKAGQGGAGGVDPRRIYEKGEVDRIVTPIRRVSPKIHSDLIRDVKVREVLLLFVVETDGLPGELRVLQSVSPEVDELVLEAVREWTFRPARKNKQLVRQWVQLPVVVKEGAAHPFRVR